MMRVIVQRVVRTVAIATTADNRQRDSQRWDCDHLSSSSVIVHSASVWGYMICSRRVP